MAFFCKKIQRADAVAGATMFYGGILPKTTCVEEKHLYSQKDLIIKQQMSNNGHSLC